MYQLLLFYFNYNCVKIWRKLHFGICDAIRISVKKFEEPNRILSGLYPLFSKTITLMTIFFCINLDFSDYFRIFQLFILNKHLDNLWHNLSSIKFGSCLFLKCFMKICVTGSCNQLNVCFTLIFRNIAKNSSINQ